MLSPWHIGFMNMRDKALELMQEWTESESLRKHMLAVETAVTAYARRDGEDEDLWAATALLHDFDYEKHPELGMDGHPGVGVAHLRANGWPEEMCVAILGHAGDALGVARETPLAKTLFACDEITGLITASVLVRPDKDIRQLGMSSLKKKYKSKAFAAGVNRADVEQGASELGVDLWEHVAFVLEAMQADAEKLGLAGTD